MYSCYKKKNKQEYYFTVQKIKNKKLFQELKRCQWSKKVNKNVLFKYKKDKKK